MEKKMTAGKSIVLMLVLSAAALMPLLVPTVQAQKLVELTWPVMEWADMEWNRGKHTSIALDSDDNPHISYQDFWSSEDDHPDLLYARWDGSTWHVETVDSAGAVGYYTSIALDSDDNPHISYYGGGDLMYARWDGSTWNIETVDSSGNVGAYSSLALDSDDNPHISYYDATNKVLKYAWWDGSTWHVETVDSAGDVGRWCSLALDSLDHPHISYCNWTVVADLMYAWWDGSTWHVETVDSAGWVGGYTSIAVDSSDCPHISYYSWTGENLKYARKWGTSWSIETVPEPAGQDWRVGEYCSLALDSLDHPHISYYDETLTDLWYTWWDGGDWNIDYVAAWAVGKVGEYCSLALDSLDRPHISCYDDIQGPEEWIRGRLLYATTSSRAAHLVVRGMNNRIYYNVWSAGSWSGWVDLPEGATCDGPAAAVLGGDLHMVVRGMTGGLYHGWVDLSTGSFTGWTLISGDTPSPPALAASEGLAKLYLVVRGMDDRVYFRAWDADAGWGGWIPLPGTTSEGPAAAVSGETLHFVVRGMAGGLWHAYYDFFGYPPFWGWWRIPGDTPSRPVLTASAAGVHLVVRGMDDRVYHNEWTPTTWQWGDWNALPTGRTCDGPASAVFGNKLHFVVRGMTGGLYHGYLDLTDGWSGWTWLSGATPSAPTLTS